MVVVSSSFLLFGEEDLAEFVAQAFRLVFARIIHRNHVGSYFFSALNGWKHTWSENKLAVLRNHSLAFGRHRKLNIEPASVGTRRFGAESEMIGIREIFIEGNVRKPVLCIA